MVCAAGLGCCAAGGATSATALKASQSGHFPAEDDARLWVGEAGLEFDDPRINDQVQEYLASLSAEEVAWGQNLAFEETASEARRKDFEACFAECAEPGGAAAASGVDALRCAHGSYFEYDIKRASNASHPVFSAGNAAASLDTIDDDDWLIRLEDANWALDEIKADFEQLEAALARQPRDADGFAALVEFVDAMNRLRGDNRPTFVARLQEVKRELAYVDWPRRMRTRLGLAHYRPGARPFHIAVFKYKVRDVREQCRAAGFAGPFFTKPTALDQGPWPYFYPAPNEITGGCCMPLSPYPMAGSELFCEIQHPKIEYRVRDLHLLGKLDTVEPREPIKALRNAHLLGVRNESGRADFGAMMNDAVNG